MEFLGRDKENVRRVDERTIAIEGPAARVRIRSEEAKVIDQLHGYDFFREPSRLSSGAPSSRRVSCDFPAIRPSEAIALLSAAAGWPVVQSADKPLESSAYLRLSVVDQPWDELAVSVLLAAGLAAHRYETIWLVTSEEVRIVPTWKVAMIIPRRFSTEDVRQRVDGAISDSGEAWTVAAAGSDGVLVVDGANGIDAALRSIGDVQAPEACAR